MSWVANVMVSVDVSEGRANLDALSEWLRSEAPLRWDSLERGVGFLSEISGPESGWGGWKNPECNVWAGALNHADLPFRAVREQRIGRRFPGDSVG